MKHLALASLALALTTTQSRADEWIQTPAGTSVGTTQLAGGDILIEANTSMSLPRGISARGTWFAPVPVEKLRDILPIWSPLPHADLEVQQFHGFAADADPGFDSLRFDENAKPVRKLLDAMRSRDGLQLTGAERGQLPANLNAGTARDFWFGVLRGRWNAFANGGLKTSGGFNARNEIKTLLREEPKIAAHFAGLLAATPLETNTLGSPVRCYWQQKVINGVAGLTIGAIYRKDSQFADFEFYVTSGYLVAFTLYELRSLEAGGRPGTLVWQENFASSELLTGAFGIKRKLARMAIESDAKRSIRAFRKDLAK